MNIHVIFGQRKCSYPGEFAPEVLDACDEYCMDENPSWFQSKMEEHIKSSDFVSVREIVVSVSDKDIERIMKQRHEVKGDVLT